MIGLPAIYQRPSDNVASLATITVETGGPAPTGYEASNLVDGNPAKVAKIDATTGAWLFDFGSAQRVDLIALIHHTFAAGTDVRLQGNATNSWGSPSFSASITIPAWLGGTLSPWPVNPWKDLRTGTTGYSASGYRYWRLLITSNDQNIHLGQVWMGATIRTFDRNYKWSYTNMTTSPTIRNQTAFLVDTFYARGTHRARFMADQLPTTAFAEELRSVFMEANGIARPWLFVPNPLANEAYFVRWSQDTLRIQHLFPNIFTHQIDIEEVGRGLRPGV